MRNWLKTRVIGRGSYGTVYAATKREYLMPVATKSSIAAIKSSMYSKSKSLQLEERILSYFKWVPEIIQSHGYEIIMEDNGDWVYNLLLEYAPHGTLADLIKKGPFLESKVTKVYMIMLLRGLSSIHQKGFVHCDFKPDNILVFPPCGNQDFHQLKIADFGLAKTPKENVDHWYWTYKFRGTPLYMSPESVSYGQIEAPLDIWSFGCVVIEMITGHNAWGAEIGSSKDLMRKIVIKQETPKMPLQLTTECLHFLTKCFETDPNQRWTANMLLNHPYLLDLEIHSF